MKGHASYPAESLAKKSLVIFDSAKIFAIQSKEADRMIGRTTNKLLKRFDTYSLSMRNFVKFVTYNFNMGIQA